jgi:hypothetical protein
MKKKPATKGTSARKVKTLSPKGKAVKGGTMFRVNAYTDSPTVVYKQRLGDYSSSSFV